MSGTEIGYAFVLHVPYAIPTTNTSCAVLRAPYGMPGTDTGHAYQEKPWLVSQWSYSRSVTRCPTLLCARYVMSVTAIAYRSKALCLEGSYLKAAHAVLSEVEDRFTKNKAELTAAALVPKCWTTTGSESHGMRWYQAEGNTALESAKHSLESRQFDAARDLVSEASQCYRAAGLL
eukprot:156433-Rhodomonas_salina.3